MNYYTQKKPPKRKPTGFTLDTAQKHAEMLANRTHKNYRRLKPVFDKKRVEAFRLYDRDIPEVRAAVDWYKNHIMLSEYAREQTAEIPYLATLAPAVSEKLGIPLANVHLRKRQTRPKEGERYKRLDHSNRKMEILEGDHKFLVNLDDFLDTGLFPDHRVTREKVKNMSKDQRVLNLYAYTASFTVYAAAGGASETDSVDASGTYMKWAKENMELNGFSDWTKHRLITSPVEDFLERSQHRKWDIIILDPPSFSTGKFKVPFDIQKDHRELVLATIKLLRKEGILLFSTNHQRFEPDLEGLPVKECKEISAETTPIDFTDRTPHRCFEIRI